MNRQSLFRVSLERRSDGSTIEIVDKRENGDMLFSRYVFRGLTGNTLPLMPFSASKILTGFTPIDSQPQRLPAGYQFTI